MTGFIRGLFGGKPKAQTTEGETNAPEQKTEAFFLAPDDAKSFGNIDYMRKSNTIRHTFPKMVNGVKEETESFIEVSAMEMKKESDLNTSNISDSVIEESKSDSDPVISERRRTDSNMDMFRKMAKDMKKG